MVDFNRSEFQSTYPRHPIDDDTAFALFFSNLGAEAMRRGDTGLAYSNFRQAAELDPDQSSLWANLGVLLASDNMIEAAESAYFHALQLDRKNLAALANLATLYHASARPEQASEVEQRMQLFRDQNPYYYYQRSLLATQKNDWAKASDLLKRALKLKRNEHQFYALQARIALQNNNQRLATEALKKALRYATQAREKALYHRQLLLLEQ